MHNILKKVGTGILGLLAILLSPLILIYLLFILALVIVVSPWAISSLIIRTKLYQRIRHEYEKQKKYIFVFTDPKYDGQYYSKNFFNEFNEHIFFDDISLKIKKPKTDMHWLALEVVNPEDCELGDDYFNKDNKVNNIGWQFRPIGIIVMTPKKFKVISYISYARENNKDEEQQRIKVELQETINEWKRFN